MMQVETLNLDTQMTEEADAAPEDDHIPAHTQDPGLHHRGETGIETTEAGGNAALLHTMTVIHPINGGG